MRSEDRGGDNRILACGAVAEAQGPGEHREAPREDPGYTCV